MNQPPLNLLLADDDIDDCMFFEQALEQLPVEATLQTVGDGEQLMRHLKADLSALPDVVFLDLNMPRKNGFDCLAEIKSSPALKHLPVIIYSTSLDTGVVKQMRETGALHYIRKPGDFSKLRKVIMQALTIMLDTNPHQPGKHNFVIEA